VSLTGIMAAVIAVLVIGLGVGGYLLKQQYEANGELKQSNAQMQEALKAKDAARQSRAQTNATVRKMAQPEKLEKLK
jgi:uncharacterized protein HemX